MIPDDPVNLPVARLPDPRQEAFVVALIERGTLNGAAGACGISPSTAKRWFAQPPVRDAYDEARRDILRHAYTKLISTAVEAIDTLRDCLDADQPAAIRVRAAATLLDVLTRAKDVMDVDARLVALEAAREQERPER